MWRKWLSILVLLFGVALTAALAIMLESVNLERLITGDQFGVTYREIPWGRNKEQILEFVDLNMENGSGVLTQYGGTEILEWVVGGQEIQLLKIPLRMDEVYWFKNGSYAYVALHFLSPEKHLGEQVEELLIHMIENRFHVPRQTEKVYQEQDILFETDNKYLWEMEDGSRIWLYFSGPAWVGSERGYHIQIQICSPK